MAKAVTIKTSGYGRVHTVQKVKPPPGPACEKCRALHTGARGGLSCGKGHALGSAADCPDCRDASAERPTLAGGVLGPARAW